MFQTALLKTALYLMFLGKIHSPKTLSDNFSVGASFDNAANVITFNWENDDPCVQYFVLQKSEDEEEWANLDTLYNSSEFESRQVLWEFRSPTPGGSSYRLKAVMDDYNWSSSLPVFIKGQPSVYDWGVAEPIIRDTLVLQYIGSGRIKGVLNVSLQNAAGTSLYKTRLASNARTIYITN
jgi:hypothetical protein